MIRIVLVRPRNPSNIGACARAMANFGLTDLVVVDPYEPIWREAKSAPGAEDLVKAARAVPSWDEAVKGCSLVLGTSSFHQRPLEHAVVELPQLHSHLAAFAANASIALVFGSERSGLSNEELSRCQAILRIPTQDKTPSMNLGQAVAVVLYEVRRKNAGPAPAGGKPSQNLEPLIESLAALGDAMDFPRGHKPAARLGRIRHALHDAVLPPAALRFLLSLSRWVRKKVPHNDLQ